MQRGYEDYGRRVGGGGRVFSEPGYQTYPGRGMSVEKYRPAAHDARRYIGARSADVGTPPYGSRDPVYPVSRPMAPEPGYGYQRSAQPIKFRFWVFRLLGLVHIALAVLLVVLGLSLFILNVEDYQDQESVKEVFENAVAVMFYGFDSACAFIIAPMVAAIGILAWLHTPSRRNLEAVRNSHMVLSVVSALLCGSLAIYESLLHTATYEGGVPDSDAGLPYTNYALWMCLIIFVALEAVFATASACFACCTPTCCTPIVNEYVANSYVYTENEPLEPLSIFSPQTEYYRRDPYAFDNRRY